MLRLRRLVRLAVALSVGALATGCAQRLAPGVREVSVHEYLFGAFGGGALDARDLCPSGSVESFEIRRSAGAYLASIASLGLYLPHQVRVRCAARSAQ
ncbi:MAG TPA: hypothetical protein VG937_02455 [Polyangiaceae bacterium]|nr:hypothetical protein [Polyangiaceae bacterium]